MMLRAFLVAWLIGSTPALAGSLSMNGTSSFGRIDSAIYSATPPATLIAFHKPTSITTIMTTIGVFNSSSTHQVRVGQQSSGAGNIQTLGSNGSSSAVSLNIDLLNAWNCAAGFHIASTSKRFLLNADVANAGSNAGNPGTITVNRTSFGVGDTNAPSLFYSGLHGPFAIFNTILSDAEVTAICKGWGLRRFWMNRILYVPYPEAGTAAMNWHGPSFALTATTDSSDGPAVRP